MKILIVSQYYYPENFKINDIASELAKKGHEITVLTGLPNYPSGIVPDKYRRGAHRKEIIDGVKVIRSWEIGRRKGPVWLGLNYISFLISSTIKALLFKENYDVIYVYQPSPVFSLIPAWILKKKKNKKIVLYCLDIWPEAMKSYLKNENNIVYRIIKRISNLLYKKCDYILVTSKSFNDYLCKEHLLPEFNINYLPQHAEETYLDIDIKHNDNDEFINFLFAGNIGIAQDIECIIDACEHIKDIPNYKVHIVGDGSYLHKIKKLVEEKKLNNFFVFHGRHPLEMMPEFYNKADACLLTLKSENVTGLTMPAKLQGYMAAGKPVIGAINGSAQEVIDESKCGFCVNASDSLALSEVMRDFILNPKKFQDCGENGRNYFINNFTKNIHIERLEEVLRKHVN
jgi:glycosyltransferase involved in cell wall biosynthesis